MTWLVFVNGFVQRFPVPFKFGKKRCSKVVDEGMEPSLLSTWSPKSSFNYDVKKGENDKGLFVMMLPTENSKRNEGNHVNFELLVSLIFEQMMHNLQKLDHVFKQKEEKGYDCPSPTHVDHWEAVTSILEGKRADVNIFFGNLKFARVGGAPSTLVGVASPVNEEGGAGETASGNEEPRTLTPQKVASGLLSIPLSNVERLKTTLSTISIPELIELVPQLGRAAKDIPDKKKLFSVQNFFRYTEAEGRFYCL